MDYNPVSCLHPKIIRNKFTGELMCVPCGICSACLSKKSALWVSRLREESTCHTYTLFGTLTYDDEHLPKIDINDLSLEQKAFLDDAIKNSSEYISFCESKIPCLRVSDFQNFIKRLRRYISYDYPEKEISIRYFCVGEYGPTTFRPHYHFLLWFDAPELFQSIKGYIYKAWKSNTNFKTLPRFLQRNKQQFVHGHAENYVAGYLYMYSHLPEILTCKPFRPFHLQSSNPPIGTIRLLKDSLQAIQSGDITKVTLHRLSSVQSVVLPMWRGLENRFFPRIIGFSKLDFRSRITLYSISRLYGEEGFESFDKFKELYFTEWQSDFPPFSILRQLFTESKERLSFEKSLRQLYNISKRVYIIAKTLGLSLSAYVERISSYYSRKDYLSLVEQIRFQEFLSNSNKNNASLSNYPFLIDRLFYENLRSLSFSSYCSYLEQFGLGKLGDYAFTAELSNVYLSKKSFCDKVVYDNHKQKIKKDYVSQHPECIRNYSLKLKSFTF